MKLLTPTVVLCILLTFAGSAFAFNPPPGRGRTISEIPSIPHQVLKRAISPRFYKSLLISPLEGYVLVRGQLNNTTHLSGLRVIHSELGGAYDALALERANAVTISGYYSTDKIIQTGNILVTLLIYKTADGIAGLSFAQVDEPSGDQQQYYGSAVLAVRKSDGKWTEIKSVDTLQGKGIVLRNNRNSKFAMREVYFFAGFQPPAR
jgi:hypothetical protein